MYLLICNIKFRAYWHVCAYIGDKKAFEYLNIGHEPSPFKQITSFFPPPYSLLILS